MNEQNARKKKYNAFARDYFPHHLLNLKEDNPTQSILHLRPTW